MADSRTEQVDQILDCLNKIQTRCTYSAIGDLLKVHPLSVGRLLGENRPRASWVVAKDSGRPTDYSPSQLHPRLLTDERIIRTSEELLQEILKLTKENEYPCSRTLAMERKESPAISDVFGLLNSWRNLPSYKLELRTAPYFAIFLQDILSVSLGREIHPVVIPEFPLRLGGSKNCKTSKAGENQSKNVDYVAFSENMDVFYLVELKTDMGSIVREQEDYLLEARSGCFRQLLRGVVEISKHSTSKNKYVHLLHQLSRLGLISIPDQLYEKSFPTPKAGWSKVLCKISEEMESMEYQPQVEVVYIQPREGKAKEEFEYIYFNQVADIVQTRSDLGAIFANYLRQWTTDAGSNHLKKFDVKN